MKSRQSCLYLSYVWPEPQSSAAGLRSLNVIQGLRQAGYRVVIASAAQNEGGRAACEALALRDPEGVSIFPIRLNDSTFDSWIAEFCPEFVIFERFVVEEQFGARVRLGAPQSVCILDTQDLHFLRLSREQRIKRARTQVSGVESESATEWDSSLVARELASIHRVDLAWLVSDFERDLLVNSFGVSATRLAVSRFAYPIRAKLPSGADATGLDYSLRSGFALLGNFRHPPNLDAFRWLRGEIWPRIRARLSRAEVHIYGAYPPKEVMQAHSPSDSFWVHGPAETLGQVFHSVRVSLAPLRFGAGIKGKISDSWWHGVPVVSTSVGQEGMTGSESTWGGIVADGTQDFADACVRLHEDEALWRQSQKQGGQLLDELFSEDRFYVQLRQSLAAARDARNGLGRDWLRQMLLQSTTDAYRYFGRWLELKERGAGRGGS